MNSTPLVNIVDAAFHLLPSKMASVDAERMLYAIGWQESRFKHRVQIGGPARGYWQFEAGGGVRGVLSHPATRDHARKVCEALDYAPEVSSVYPALADNDILAACFARLNLWWLPQALPKLPDEGWNQYISAWRPGKPHPNTWRDAWAFATATLNGFSGEVR